MNFSVTGATGLLGNNIVRRLLQQNHKVRVCIRPESDQGSLEGLDIEILIGDLNNEQFVRQCVANVDGLFHAAGLVWLGCTRQKESWQTNVELTRNLAQVCVAESTRLVYVSSVDALAAGTRDLPANEDCLDPPKGKSGYVVSKRGAERYLLGLFESGDLDLVIVNPGLMIGPYDWKPSSAKMILSITDGFVPASPRGGISVADVRNVADGTIAAMIKGRSGQRYILAGENLLYQTLFKKMAALVGRKGPVLGRLGPVNAWLVGKAGDLAGLFFGESNINSESLRQGQQYNYYDSSKAIKELGYDPGSFDTALADAWKWLVDHNRTKHR